MFIHIMVVELIESGGTSKGTQFSQRTTAAFNRLKIDLGYKEKDNIIFVLIVAMTKENLENLIRILPYIPILVTQRLSC